MSAGREIELKLETTPEGLDAVAAHPSLRERAIAPPLTRRLFSVYFDTAQLELMRQRIGFRLRRTDSGWVQTVKTRDEGRTGLFVRGEDEVALPGALPDPGAVADDALRARLHEALGGQALVPVFETEMQRTAFRLADGDDVWKVELDRGEARHGARREEFCEVELELERGDPVRLFAHALELLDAALLRPCTRSKAERGYALRAGLRPRAEPYAPPRAEGGAPPPAGLESAIRHALPALVANAGLAAEDAEAADALGRAAAALASAAARAEDPLAPELHWIASALAGPIAAAAGDLASRRFARLLLELGRRVAHA